MHDELRLTIDDRENLVAYLDRELPAPEREELELKLSRSLSGRRELEALQKTWELLDFLPKPRVPENFTERTLDRIDSQDLEEELRVRKASAAMRWAGTLLVWTVSVAGVFLVGLVGTRFLVPSPTQEALEVLPILERLPAYEDVQTFDFLQALEGSPMVQNREPARQP